MYREYAERPKAADSFARARVSNVLRVAEMAKSRHVTDDYVFYFT